MLGRAHLVAILENRRQQAWYSLGETHGRYQASLETSYAFMLPCLPEYVKDIAVYFGRRGVGALELALELETGLHCLGDVGCGSERGPGGGSAY